MHRLELVPAIAQRLQGVLGEAGLLPTDTLGNLKEPFDDAFRALGYPEGELATADEPNALGLIAMAQYRVLTTALDRVVGSFDLSAGGDQLRLNQVVTNIERMLARTGQEVVRIWGSTEPYGSVAEPSLVHIDFGSRYPELAENQRW